MGVAPSLTGMPQIRRSAEMTPAGNRVAIILIRVPRPTRRSMVSIVSDRLCACASRRSTGYTTIACPTALSADFVQPRLTPCSPADEGTDVIPCRQDGPSLHRAWLHFRPAPNGNDPDRAPTESQAGAGMSHRSSRSCRLLPSSRAGPAAAWPAPARNIRRSPVFRGRHRPTAGRHKACR